MSERWNSPPNGFVRIDVFQTALTALNAYADALESLMNDVENNGLSDESLFSQQTQQRMIIAGELLMRLEKLKTAMGLDLESTSGTDS